MSDKKIIIRNCPCYIDMPLNNHDKVCRLGDIVKPNHKELYVYCQDCTDCKLKQIVELAQGHTELCKNCEQQIKECDCSDICNAYRLDKILKLLDLQEVE
jgi:hypothetical protein